MCQLLGMNCNVPTDICFSFEGFCSRGGRTDHHADGWGIAFFEGRGVRMFIDSKSAVESAVATLVRSYPIHSKNVIAHIRKATHGPVALENTHPFIRELWGRYWIFAHNGTLNGFAWRSAENYQTVGATDSEQAFCYMLETLRESFLNRRPELNELEAALRGITSELAQYGTFNYLLSNGECLFAHCSDKLCYIIREAPFGHAHLVDQDVTVDFSLLTRKDDRVSVIATSPLTDNEQWTTMAPGQLLMFVDGAPVLARRAAHDNGNFACRSPD